jgi:hypothetical protein
VTRLRDGAAAVALRLRHHWPMVLIVSVGTLVRLLTMVAYSPALLFPDSWGYIATAYSGAFIGLPTIHPDGYPLLIKLLTLPDRSLLELVAIQHLAGVGVGVVIYMALTRARLPRWGAAAAAALVLLDGYAITLEQYVMSDTFFEVTMLAAALILAWPRLLAEPLGGVVSWRRALPCGLLLAFAALQREAAPFTVPVFLLYLAWIRAGWRTVVVFVLAFVIPLSAYSALVDHKYHVFGLTATSGWTLYGRVGGFADCAGATIERAAMPLCESKAQRARHPSAPDWYVWGPSPAQRLFDPADQPISKVASTNSVLLSFSETIIAHQPLAFAGATAADFLRYFTPGATAYDDAISATSLPRSASAEATAPATRKRDLPGLQLSVRSPAGLVRWYRGIFHVPRPVLALLALAALLAVALRVASRPEIVLLAGTGVALLLGTAATGGFGLRYLIPAVPLLAIGGSLAVVRIGGALRGARTGGEARPDTGKSATMDL